MSGNASASARSWLISSQRAQRSARLRRALQAAVCITCATNDCTKLAQADRSAGLRSMARRKSAPVMRSAVPGMCTTARAQASRLRARA